MSSWITIDNDGPNEFLSKFNSQTHHNKLRKTRGKNLLVVLYVLDGLVVFLYPIS